MVAVAPGAAAPSDGASGDGSLDSLSQGEQAGTRARPGRKAGSGAEDPTTTIDLSAAADPAPRRRGVVPLRHIVGARPRSGRWQARARRSVRVGVWVAAAATVGAGLVALWVLLFTTVSGGDVWLGRPLTPARHDENATRQGPAPGGPGADPLRPTGAAKPSATVASKAATPSHTSGKGSGGSATGSGSGVPGRNGADDPLGDVSGGTGTSAATTGATSGGSGGGSGSSGSGGGGSSGSLGGSGSSGSGGHGADD